VKDAVARFDKHITEAHGVIVQACEAAAKDLVLEEIMRVLPGTIEKVLRPAMVYKTKKGQNEQDVIEVTEFRGEPSHVGCSAGLTLNMGDFNSARFDVTVRYPVCPGDEERAFVKAQDFVTTKLEEETKKISAYVVEKFSQLLKAPKQP
jgi:nitrate reductase NapAB chaperone NapD